MGSKEYTLVAYALRRQATQHPQLFVAHGLIERSLQTNRSVQVLI